jgi:hypothetical protein
MTNKPKAEITRADLERRTDGIAAPAWLKGAMDKAAREVEHWSEQKRGPELSQIIQERRKRRKETKHGKR